jgi:putative acetyltransferase
VEIRRSRITDRTALLDLYLRVARVPGGLARLASEIDAAYVDDFLGKALKSGISYVAVTDEDQLAGEIHAYSPGLFCFSHVLGDLTIAVDPETQGMGVGRKLFAALMNDVTSSRPEISRVELIARESNVGAIRFYESLGFAKEGRLRQRIKNPDGSLESDVPMAWTRD